MKSKKKSKKVKRKEAKLIQRNIERMVVWGLDLYEGRRGR